MNNPTQAAPANLSGTTSLELLRNAGIIVIGSLIVAACAHVAVPLSFTPVPLTLQPFAVLLLGLALSPRMAAMTLAAYLAEGAMGLPVFAPGVTAVSGFAHLAGPTGGYLIAYPVAAYAIASLWRGSNRSLVWALISAAAGNIILLGMGALWLGILTGARLNAVLTEAVIPFLPGDGLKVAVAAVAGFEWYRVRRHHAAPTV